MTLNGPHAAAGLCGGWPPPHPCRNLTPRLMKRVLASTLFLLIRGLDNGVNHNLQENIGYTKQAALERDKESIAAVFRLRRGRVFTAIEDCRALFVTANRELAYSTRRFADFNYQIGVIPVSLTDYEVTNLVWLKSPTVAPNLPRKRLIADCYAAIQPGEHLWMRYLTTIDRLEEEGKITSDQYFVLRHSIQAKSELMDLTLGDEVAFTGNRRRDSHHDRGQMSRGRCCPGQLRNTGPPGSFAEAGTPNVKQGWTLSRD